MKISIIGAGNVGGLLALHLVQQGMDEVYLIDIAKGLAQAKALDLEDSRFLTKINYQIYGSEEIKEIKDSRIVVVTAGFTRRPGMSREDLLSKNAQIIKEISLKIKEFAPHCILIMVTNPLDLMTRLSLEITGFKPWRVLGMGLSLDASRFANLISKKLNISINEIEPCVIGSHGEGMLPLARLTKIRGISLEEFLTEAEIKDLVKRTIQRGAEIVSLLASGSAYLAPSLAGAEIVKVIAKDQKRIISVSTYLKGEYGLNDVCIGVPCRLGKEGVEEIIELDLNKEEKEALEASSQRLKEQYKEIKI